MATLIDLDFLKTYDSKKGTAVKEVDELPEEAENRVYNVGEKIYSKKIELLTKNQYDSEAVKTVNSIEPTDNNITLTGENISVSSSDSTTLTEAISNAVEDATVETGATDDGGSVSCDNSNVVYSYAKLGKIVFLNITFDTEEETTFTLTGLNPPAVGTLYIRSVVGDSYICSFNTTNGVIFSKVGTGSFSASFTYICNWQKKDWQNRLYSVKL